jgi:hypothetical protein
MPIPNRGSHFLSTEEVTMSAHRKNAMMFTETTKPLSEKKRENFLKEILDFGVNDAPQSNRTEINERIRKLVKELEEINRRIDDLAHR